MYPLVKLLLVAGVVLGVVVSAVFGDILIGVILFVGFACMGLEARMSDRRDVTRRGMCASRPST